MQLFLSRLEFLAQFAAQLGGLVAADFVRCFGFEWRYRRGFAVVVDGNHGEETAIGVADDLVADAFGEHLDADFHRGVAGVIDRGEEGDQFADVDGLAEHDLIDRQRHDILAGAGVGDLVEQLEDGAAVYVA